MNRNDVEEFYESLLRPRKFDAAGVNEAFDVSYSEGLNRDAKEKYLKQKNDPYNNKLLINLSHKLMDESSALNRRDIPDNKFLSRNLSHLILTIYDTAELPSIDRKTDVVDALCHLFGIPIQPMEPPPRSSASVFLDLANKVVGYVAVFSSKTASLVTGINLVFGLLRYANEDEEYASSRHAVEMIFCTVLTSICANFGSGYDKGLLVNIMGLVCKGLCISLSHYAASWPFLANKLAATGGWHDGAAHFMLNFHAKLANDASISQSSLHHGTIFILSTIWPLMTYMAYFGSNIWNLKNLAMLAYFYSTSAAFMAHKIPRGGPVSALSLITGSRPDVVKIPYLYLNDMPLPPAIHDAIEKQHALDLETFKRADPRYGATLRIDTTTTVTVKDANLYALVFLDIMKTFLRIWRRPVIADAFDVLSPSSDQSFAWSAAVIMNSWSVAPCTPRLRSMHGYDVTEMRVLANNVIFSPFANRALFHHTDGNPASLNSQDSRHSKLFDAISQLLQPTIDGFLYAYQTRSYGPEIGGIGCLGLDQYKIDTYDANTIDFLNRMDKHFFKALKTELGINESQLGGATRFYEYKRRGPV
jgi:hypothetical protein